MTVYYNIWTVDHRKQTSCAKRSMQVGHSPLRRAFVPSYKCSIFHLSRSFQPPLNVQQNPLALRMLSDGAHDEGVIQIVKESFDIQIQNPVIPPASLPCYSHRFDCRLSRPVSIRVWMKMRFHLRLQIQLYHHLRNPVGYRGYSQRPFASVVLWYLHGSHRRRKVTPRRHPIPELIEIPLEVRLKLFNRFTV